MKNKKVKSLTTEPWLNKDGTPKSDEDLKKNSPFWSKETWEAYLSTLEKEREEYLLSDPRIIENFSAEAYARFLMSMDGTEKGLDQLRVLAQTCLNQLSQRESEVLKKIFFEKKSERQIAEELGVSRNSIKSFKYRGLNKIKQTMRSGNFCQKTMLDKEFSMTDFP